MFRTLICFVFLPLASSNALSHHEAQLVGHWVSSLGPAARVQQPPPPGSVREVTCSFRPNHTFSQSAQDLPTVSGKWHLEGNDLVTEASEKINGATHFIKAREKITKLTADEVVFTNDAVEAHWWRRGLTTASVQPTTIVFPDEAKTHGWRMLDTHSRARAYASWCTIPATEAEFFKMQQHYRPNSFAMWTKRLRQLQPGMTKKQIIKILQSEASVTKLKLTSSGDIILLNDAYFASVYFNKRKRMISATTPLAITYEIKPAQKKRPPKKHI